LGKDYRLDEEGRTFIMTLKCWRGVAGVVPVEDVLPCFISINLRVHFM